MSQYILNTCKILILLYSCIWYKLYPADTINIHHTFFSTLRPWLIIYTTTLTCLVPTFIHICLINTLLFVMDLYDSVSVTIKDLHFAFMTTLFGEWCSGRSDIKRSMSQFVYVHAHIGHHRWIWPFASCATFQPCKMTFTCSYIQVISHLCIFTTLHWVFHFIVFLHDVL